MFGSIVLSPTVAVGKPRRQPNSIMQVRWTIESTWRFGFLGFCDVFTELFLFFEENWERLSENECQLAVCRPLIHTYQVPLCGNGEKAFCFSGCTFELLKICLWKPTDVFFPSSYKSSEEESFHFHSLFSSVYRSRCCCRFSRAQVWEKQLFSCRCMCSSERLGGEISCAPIGSTCWK